jgi:hypothetical protein
MDVRPTNVVKLVPAQAEQIERLLEDLRSSSPVRGAVLVVLDANGGTSISYTGLSRLELIGALAAASTQLWVAPQLREIERVTP